MPGHKYSDRDSMMYGAGRGGGMAVDPYYDKYGRKNSPYDLWDNQRSMIDEMEEQSRRGREEERRAQITQHGETVAACHNVKAMLVDVLKKTFMLTTSRECREGDRFSKYTKERMPEDSCSDLATWKAALGKATTEREAAQVAWNKVKEELRHMHTRAYWSKLPVEVLTRLSGDLSGTVTVSKLQSKHENAEARATAKLLEGMSDDMGIQDLKAAMLDRSHTLRERLPAELCPKCGKRNLVARDPAVYGVQLACPNDNDVDGCNYVWSSRWGDMVDDTKTQADCLRQLGYLLSDTFTITGLREVASKTTRNMQPCPLPTRFDTDDEIFEGWRTLCLYADSNGCDVRLRDAIKEHAGEDAFKRIDTVFRKWQTASAPYSDRKPAEKKNITAVCGTMSAGGTISTKDEVKTTMANVNTVSGDKTALGNLIDTVVATSKEDTVDAAWRTAADEATEMAKPVVKKVLRDLGGAGAPFTKFAIAAIDKPIGDGVVSLVTGWAIMGYGPLRGKELGPKTMRLSKELRIRGFKPLTDLVARKVLAPIRKQLTVLVEGLPSVVGEA